ncbi:hypothetical protein [Pseudoprimorskyibacter insulae]|uniref:Uncharacterized protein n=1 Tax=Pseudoprimorskyibacter insulae TaxID=1695997 RepID=A0A2R8AW26_9RHOB|nr:hypothetical protein [Pseudoprimorskyibacter insulae]SPF80094.1 hypothetical protein PRI8871_01896 [Pseudoprimorskyibacter insulae]
MLRQSRQKHSSVGEMISTICFAGVSLWLLSAAAEAPMPKAVVLGVCSVFCMAAAARFLIARAVNRFLK